jgi:tRNA pseudouridine38-40 synthase
MPTYRLTLEYDGTAFHGWQQQPHARTVAGVLLDAIHLVTGERPRLTAAGRTDAGAHAHGQVVGVSLSQTWELERLKAALNASLPADVAVVAAMPHADGFDARRDAVDRTYRYVVVCRDGRAPVTRRHTWTVRGPLDLSAMRAAAQRLVGTHDFAAFGGATNPGSSTVRTVHTIEVTQHVIDADEREAHLDTVVITVRANAFLRGMMRAFAGALVKVGQGRLTPEWFSDVIDAGPARSPQIALAPARGLHQWRVSYAHSPAVAA